MTATPSDMLPALLIALFKGVVEREASPALWQALSVKMSGVRDYVGTIGLDLVLDDTEGFAYLRQKPQGEGEMELPRLIARRPLSYPVSLTLALLRKKLAEFDATGGQDRLVMTGREILDLVQVYLPDTVNEAKLQQRVTGYINKIVELGFLKPLKGHANTFEVKRILRSFVDAQWLSDFNERLDAYIVHGETSYDLDVPVRPEGAVSEGAGP